MDRIGASPQTSNRLRVWTVLVGGSPAYSIYAKHVGKTARGKPAEYDPTKSPENRWHIRCSAGLAPGGVVSAVLPSITQILERGFVAHRFGANASA